MTFRATVAALAAAQLLAWAALYYTYSLFVLPMQGEFGWTAAETMGAYTLGLALWAAGTWPAGAAIDRGHARALMTGGALLAAAGFALWSQARSLGALYAAWALLGPAMAALLYEPAFAELTRRYPSRYVRGITVLTLAGGLASTLAFPAAAALIAAFGWREALGALAATMALAVAPLNALALAPASPDAAPATTVAADDRDGGTPGASLAEAAAAAPFWLLAASFTLQAFTAAALWAHMMPALAARGLDTAAALGVVVWFGPAQVAGRAAFARWGARASMRTIGIAVFALMPAALLLFALGAGFAAMVAFAVLFGVANGMTTIVRGALLPQLYGRGSIGRIAGAIGAIALGARAAAPLAAAALLLAVGGYHAWLIALAVLAAAAVATFAAATRRASRRTGGL